MLQEEWQIAVDLLETIIKTPQLDATKEKDRQESLRDLERDLATALDRLGESAKAMEIYQKVLLKNPDDYVNIFDIIVLLGKEDKDSEMIEFLQELQQSSNEKTGLNRLTEIHHVFATEPDFHKAIVKAAKRAQNLNVIKEAYKTAIDAAQLKQKSAIDTIERLQSLDTFGNLLYYFALALFEHHVNIDEELLAIDLWEKAFQLQMSKKYSTLRYTQRNTAK